MSEEVSPFVGRELASLLLGQQIGYGSSRTTYESPLLPDRVIKVETNGRSFQNAIEWETWLDVKETPYAIHFAPCEAISVCGGVLVMRRTQPMTMAQLPPRMPGFFCDFKRSNYGILDGRVVCHDYGLKFTLHNGTRLHRVEWRDE